MTTAKKTKGGRTRGSAFEKTLIRAAREAQAFVKGDLTGLRRSERTVREVESPAAPTWTPSRVVEVRKIFSLSQAAFAQMLNVSPATVRSWEQGARTPDGPSARLIEVAEQSPEALRAFSHSRTETVITKTRTDSVVFTKARASAKRG